MRVGLRIASVMPLKTRCRSRRGVLLSLLGVGLAPVAALAAGPSTLAFDALRNGRRIGRQLTTFERGEALTVRTHAEMAVALGPITVYRYLHEATERWDGDGFVGLQTRTSQNGRIIQVSAARVAGGVRIEAASGQRLQAPADAVPFSHWNRAIAGHPLFDPQDGKLLREQASAPERASIPDAAGGVIAGVRVAYRGDVEIDDYYDEAATWVRLVGRLPDRSQLEYRRA